MQSTTRAVSSQFDDWKQNIPRQSDADAFSVIYTGGVRVIERDGGRWHVEPLFDGTTACAKGFMSRERIQAFLSQAGLKPIAFHRIGWHRGVYNSSWSPIVPGEGNHFQGPADDWSQIAGNLSRDRAGSELGKMAAPTDEQLSTLLDNQDEAERLAQSISLSLRSMDISIESITDFYNEQLVNLMVAGHVDGTRSGTTSDQMLYAHVHSFFMHLGAARDYLAALIAARLGRDVKKTDSMAKLVEIIRADNISADALLGLLVSEGYFRPKSTSQNKFEINGWLEDVTRLRNEFMHRRPYGDKFVEKWGYAKPIAGHEEIFRYVRPILLPDGAEHDVLDLIAYHYRSVCRLFKGCASKSGYNAQILTLTDQDILSVNFPGPDRGAE